MASEGIYLETLGLKKAQSQEGVTKFALKYIMENDFYHHHHDLASPDGKIVHIQETAPYTYVAKVLIENISPAFAGYANPQSISFNIKSTLAQLGIHGILTQISIHQQSGYTEMSVVLKALGPIAKRLLPQLTPGCYIGKLFAALPERRVRDPEYLLRMFGRSDRRGHPLLSLGGPSGRDELLLEKIDGRTVAFLELQKGTIIYDEMAVMGLIPSLLAGLKIPTFKLRSLIQLHQKWVPENPRKVQPGELLLAKTHPLHVRTVFGKVVAELLPPEVFHTSADILEPDTTASGDVYEFFGTSQEEMTHVPIEFYTLEPYREHVFFADRDQLQSCLDDPLSLFQAFKTAPEPELHRASVFVVKGEQLLHLKPKDWILRQTHRNPFPGLFHSSQQAAMVHGYISQQPCYPFLKNIEEGLITSQGVLLTRYFPSPLMKQLLLSDTVQRCVKAIYFQYPSLSHGSFFSHEDRSMLLDLAKFGISVFWVDSSSTQVLQYIPKPDKDSGMFVPSHLVDDFIKATVFGIYGSTLLHDIFESELQQLLEGLQRMKTTLHHPMMNLATPLALVTGGGPGVMEMGNKIAKKTGFLSCANIVDFRNSSSLNVAEQKQNQFVDAKMTYRLDRLVERQAEFHLDFPIILMGGFGTDFEQSLEEVRRKVGSNPPTPVLLFGKQEYWRSKMTSRFQANLQGGTISKSEWVANCFYCIEKASEGLAIYESYFRGTLPIGPNHHYPLEGFHIYTAGN